MVFSKERVEYRHKEKFILFHGEMREWDEYEELRVGCVPTSVQSFTQATGKELLPEANNSGWRVDSKIMI